MNCYSDRQRRNWPPDNIIQRHETSLHIHVIRTNPPEYDKSISSYFEAVSPSDIAIVLNRIGLFHYEGADHTAAEPLYRQALAINEQIFGKDHPNVAIAINYLALLLQATNRLSKAEPLMRQHLEIFLRFTHATGHQHPHLEAALGNYNVILMAMGLSETQARQKINAVLDPFGMSLSG